jgi:Transcriptional regulator/sugar kinase
MNASALAEMLFGTQKNIGNFVYVGVTNGIGAGIIANNSLFEGDMGFSGEIGHTTVDLHGPKCACGNTGCLELYASIPVVIANAEKSVSKSSDSKMKLLDKIKWTDIIENAINEDKLALELIDSLCYFISFGLVSLINMFDPRTIYLGHEIALAGELVTTRLQTHIRDRIFCRNYKSVPVKISTFGDKAPVAGATSIILDRLFSGKII